MEEGIHGEGVVLRGRHEEREESIVALDQNQHQDHHPRNVVAPMEGHVVEVLVKDGMRVKKGQLIVVLESMEYEVQNKTIKETKEHEEEGTKAIVTNTETLIDPIVEFYKNLLDEERNLREGIFYMEDVLVNLDDVQEFPKAKLGNGVSPDDWADKIKKELNNLEQHLPEGIFVRAYKERMELLRVVIIGQEGTPYHHGLFFFDVCFPRALYHSGGLCINPNLTSSGRNLFNTEPLFNDIAYKLRCSKYKERASLLYNENTLVKSLKTMVYIMNKPPKNFEDFVVGHFRNHMRDILMAYKAYMDGLRVGCPVNGLREEGNKGSCSIIFKNDLTSCLDPLVAAFKKIGATTEAQDLL
ncbi:ubiquitin-conjugating enzyme/RWD-like protein [Tanacetum coccineum]